MIAINEMLTFRGIIGLVHYDHTFSDGCTFHSLKSESDALASLGCRNISSMKVQYPQKMLTGTENTVFVACSSQRSTGNVHWSLAQRERSHLS